MMTECSVVLTRQEMQGNWLTGRYIPEKQLIPYISHIKNYEKRSQKEKNLLELFVDLHPPEPQIWLLRHIVLTFRSDFYTKNPNYRSFDEQHNHTRMNYVDDYDDPTLKILLCLIAVSLFISIVYVFGIRS